MIVRTAAALLCLLPMLAFGQEKRLEFEVASIKPNNSFDGRMMVRMSPGGFSGKGLTMRFLIMAAYDVKDFQIAGGPAWLGSERFDIEGKTGDTEAPDPSKMSPAERKTNSERVKAMLRSLLADRFQMKFHEESKEAPAYALVVGKNGPKLKKAEEGPEVRQMMRMGRGMLTASRITMEQLAGQLSDQVGRKVVDKSGVAGEYDLELKWTPEVGQSGPMGTPPPGDAPPPVDASGPTIFTAVQEQLGLKLEGTKTQVKVIAIDSIEKPSAN